MDSAYKQTLKKSKSISSKDNVGVMLIINCSMHFEENFKSS